MHANVLETIYLKCALNPKAKWAWYTGPRPINRMNFSKNGFRKGARLASVCSWSLASYLCMQCHCAMHQTRCDRFQVLKHHVPAHSSDGVQMVKEQWAGYRESNSLRAPCVGKDSPFRATPSHQWFKGACYNSRHDTTSACCWNMPLRRPSHRV